MARLSRTASQPQGGSGALRQATARRKRRLGAMAWRGSGTTGGGGVRFVGVEIDPGGFGEA